MRAGGQGLEDAFSALGGLDPWKAEYTDDVGDLNCKSVCHISIRQWESGITKQVIFMMLVRCKTLAHN